MAAKLALARVNSMPDKPSPQPPPEKGGGVKPEALLAPPPFSGGGRGEGLAATAASC